MWLLLLVACTGKGALSDLDTSADTGADTGEGTDTSGDTSGDTSDTQEDTGGPLRVEDVVEELRADRDGTILRYGASRGWPIWVDEGYLFVSIDPTLNQLSGDFVGWSGGMPMAVEDDFAWVIAAYVADGDGYKFTDGSRWVADPIARSYQYDEYGEISLVQPVSSHIDRWMQVGDDAMEPRELRVWVPEEPVTHLLYAMDGQNLFDPNGIWGGWHLQDSLPPGVMVVGIDNTAARMEEYTHVPDVIDGDELGGEGDAFADFLQGTVRPLVRGAYGEPAVIGLMGSSLGGLISFHVADRYPGEYAFAASLSGTMGWGSIGAHNETLIERLGAHGHQATALYLDSGGGGDCWDADGDGIYDDNPDAADNYCENVQLRDVLDTAGYEFDEDLWHWWEPDAPHNEAAWAARVWRPLEIFAGL